jgi:hypothetical protein
VRIASKVEAADPTRVSSCSVEIKVLAFLSINSLPMAVEVNQASVSGTCTILVSWTIRVVQSGSSGISVPSTTPWDRERRRQDLPDHRLQPPHV